MKTIALEAIQFAVFLGVCWLLQCLWTMPEGFSGAAIGTALAIGLGVSAAAGVAGAAISSHAAGSAADKQSAAADKIAADAKAAADAAKQGFNTATDTANQSITDATKQLEAGITDANGKIDAAKAQQLEALKPYLEAGQISLQQAQEMLGKGGALGPDAKQFSFTPQDWQNDPQYAFIRDEANKALERSAAARGGLYTGGLVKASDRLNTNLTNTFLDSAFARAKGTYDENRTTALARLSGLQGITNLGFSATGVANQDIGNAAQTINSNDLTKELTAAQYKALMAGNVINAGKYSGDVGLRAADIAASAISGKANAQSASDIASANAWNSGLGSVANSVNRAYALYSLPKVTGADINGTNILNPNGTPGK